MKIINNIQACLFYFFITMTLSISLAHAFEAQVIHTNTQTILEETLGILVSFQTLSHQKDENLKALNWVKQQLYGLPLIIKDYKSNGYPSLIITTKNTKAPKLWLIAHMDVVPATPSGFHMKAQGDKLLGRGVLDMKVAIACYITLLKEIGPALKNYDIGVMLTSDEEVGGMNGVRYLLNQENYGGQFGFLPDGGFNWSIEKDAKGLLWIKIKTNGIASHGSRPWLGVNAINNLTHILDELNHYFDKIKSNASSKSYYTTMNVGLIHGGNAANQVPDHAEASIDIRYTNHFNLHAFNKYLQTLIQSTPGASYEILLSGEPNHMDLNRPEVKQFKAFAKKRYDIELGTMQSHGATDARFFSAKKIPVLIIAPTGGDIHSEQEWLSRKDYYRFYNVFKDWVFAVGKEAPSTTCSPIQKQAEPELMSHCH